MATVYATVNGQARSSTVNAAQTAPNGGGAGKIIAEYEASSLATASTVNFCTIPANSHYRVKQLAHDAMGSNTSIAVGVAGSTAGQIADRATVAAGVLLSDAGGWKHVSVDTDIIGTTTGTMTGTLQLEVEFVRSGQSLTL